MNTILLIEDNTDNRENTCELLELEGYKVISADNGMTGIELAKTQIPNIILCDIHMPGKDGYEVIKQLKQGIRTANIPFIFLTASAERSEVQIGFDLGAVGYIRKPFEKEELYDTITKCLEEK